MAGQPEVRACTHLGYPKLISEPTLALQPPAHLYAHCPSTTSPGPVLPLLSHFADINTFMVEQIIKFAKELPLFRYVSPSTVCQPGCPPIARSTV